MELDERQIAVSQMNDEELQAELDRHGVVLTPYESCIFLIQSGASIARINRAKRLWRSSFPLMRPTSSRAPRKTPELSSLLSIRASATAL